MERQRAKHLWSFRSWVWQGRRDQGQQHRDNEHQTTVPLLQRSQRQVLWILLPWRGRIYLRGCASNLYVSFDGMTYDKTNGKFTGNVVTNQCRYYENKDDTRHKPDCCGELVGPSTQDKFPSRGRVAWSVKGQNIYGPFEAGFGKEGVTKDSSTVTTNTKPPYPCFNAASGKYYGYCSPGVDVSTCENKLLEECQCQDLLKVQICCIKMHDCQDQKWDLNLK